MSSDNVREIGGMTVEEREMRMLQRRVEVLETAVKEGVEYQTGLIKIVGEMLVNVEILVQRTKDLV